MKILLLDPKRINLETYLIIPNVGLGYIATALKRSGHEVQICNAARDNIFPDKAAEIASSDDFDVIGINIFTPFFNSAAAYAKAFKSKLPDAKLISGGPHSIFEPEEVLRKIPQIDFAVTGEGEETFPLLLDAVRANGSSKHEFIKTIPNLAYIEKDVFIQTPRKIIEDIKKLDLPAWDLMEPNKYDLFPNGIFTKRKKIAPIITSRGCPYPCTFCGAGYAMGKKVRHRDSASVVEEMSMLNERYGIGEIHIMDDNFIADRAFAVDVCKRIAALNKDIVWACPTGIRLDGIDDELAKLMSSAGCYSTAVGIESGSPRVLSLMRKKLNPDIVPEKINILRKNRIKVTGFFIIGFPGETLDEAKQTVSLSLKLDINRANFFNFTPFPGSELYNRLKEEGKIPNLNYDETYIHTLSYCDESIPLKDLVKLQRNAHFRFYLRPKIIFNLIREIHSFSQLKIIFQRSMKIIFPGESVGK